MYIIGGDKKRYTQKIESLSNKAVKQYYNMMDGWMDEWIESLNGQANISGESNQYLMIKLTLSFCMYLVVYVMWCHVPCHLWNDFLRPCLFHRKSSQNTP